MFACILSMECMMKISQPVKSQWNLQNLYPSKITVYPCSYMVIVNVACLLFGLFLESKEATETVSKWRRFKK